ncbi:MAG: carbon starvation CstA family protein, partial [Bryobacteraceae bacterium]
MGKIVRTLLWLAVSCVGALALAGVALRRGEPINSAWLVTAAVCTYLAAYRFYSAFIAAKVMALDDRRATAAERLR